MLKKWFKIFYHIITIIKNCLNYSKDNIFSTIFILEIMVIFFKIVSIILFTIYKYDSFQTLKSTAPFTSTMAQVFNFSITFISRVYLFELLFDSYCSFVNSITFFFSKLIVFTACSVKDSQNFFMQFSSLYALCLFPISQTSLSKISYAQREYVTSCSF